MEIFKKYSFDKLLFFSTIALLIYGIIMVFSSSAILAAEKYRQSFYFLTQQIVAGIFGLILMLVIASIRQPFFTWSKAVYLITGISFALLLLCFLMPPAANAHRWVQLFGLRFQPSELAKISIVLFLANYCSKKAPNLNNWKTLIIPLGVVMAFVLAILIEPDYSTAAFVFLISAIILYLGGVKLKYFLILGLVAIIIFGLFLLSANYRLNRVHGFLSPDKDPLGKAFQIRQSKLAVGAGGLLGVSLGASTQKLYFLPCAHTDFIFAIIGEEIGLLGTMLTVGLFVIFLLRGLKIANRASSTNYQLIAYGLTLSIIIQALMNISVVLGLGPVTGIPLPFISFGRSALLCNLIAVGILLNISQRKLEVI
ncbi:MAG: putative lipid II flippase FtsW [Candidatus Aminicenantes bacterium]|nr:putative lipid II flippase FtsW [Candidatus Aminicenantes bacterium]